MYWRMLWGIGVGVLLTVLPLQADNSPTVLLLNSYHPQYQWTQELTRGVQDALAGSLSKENLHVEYMDSRRFVDDVDYHRQLRQFLAYKYRQFSPDVIITSDDSAFDFMLKHGDSLFAGKPVVFSGVNVFDAAVLQGKNNFTGILEGMEIEGNLDLIRQVQPQVNRIILLGDSTGLGLRMVQRARQIQLNWKSSVQLEIWDRFSLQQLYRQVASLPKDSAILMLAIHKDNQGQYFSFERELPLLSQFSQVPVYGMWGSLMVGNGALGGLVNNPYQHGKRAANMALTILAGVPISDIPIQKKAQYLPEFDFHQLQRFHIAPAQLPDGSRLLNRPMGLYQKYQLEITALIVLLVFLMVVITLLLNSNRKRKLAQQQLAQLNMDLESNVRQRTLDLASRNKELEQANARMEKLAHTDSLTGLGNRRAGSQEVEAYVHRYLLSHLNFSLAILDVDYFKQVNDQYGHQVGDEVLFTLAQALKHALRPSDHVYRWGGEEFLLALPNTDAEFAMAVCQRVRKSVHAIDHSAVGKVTVSIGLATLNEADDFDTLLQRCDDMLYQAKANGRNQVVAAKA